MKSTMTVTRLLHVTNKVKLKVARSLTGAVCWQLWLQGSDPGYRQLEGRTMVRSGSLLLRTQQTDWPKKTHFSS